MSPTVLIIDDDSLTVRKVVEKELSRASLNVITAADAASGFRNVARRFESFR